MKIQLFDKTPAALAVLFLVVFLAASPTKGPQTFIGSTPCSVELKQMLHIPDSSKVEFVTWKLLLVPHGSAQPTFKLDYIYGLSKPGTRGFMNGGTKAELTGTWKFEDVKNALPGKYLIRLKAGSNDMTFLSLDPHAIHLLDSKGQLMVGNAAWSYTLTEQPKL